MNYDTIIIGAGVTGLAAAYHLTQHGKKVLVLEKGAEAGGLLASYSIHDFKIEKFYHHILGGDTTLQDFIHEVGLGNKLVWLPASVGYLLDRTVYKLDTPMDILKFPALNIIDKLRLAYTVKYVQHTKNTARFDNQPAKDWLIQHAGKNVFHNFFEPLLHGKFGENINNISAAWMMERIRIRSSRSVTTGEKLGYLEGGFSSLVDTLCDKISHKHGEIRLGVGVNKLVIKNNKIQGVQTDKETILANSVINTTSPRLLAKMAEDEFPPAYINQLNQIQFQHTICILIGLDCKITDTYWLNIANKNLPFAVMLEHTNFYNRIYGNSHIIYLASYIQDLNDPIWKKSDEEIFQIYFDGLQNVFNISAENLLWWKLSRGLFTSPVYNKGYLSKMLPMNTPIEGLYTAGMMHSYPERSINDSIYQGLRAARLILKQLT